ncbi:MAG: hypothetical protein WEA56_14205 [Balneolaceae bacterium]
MTRQEIYDHILVTLAHLYEHPLHRTQYYRFTFAPSDEQQAQYVLSQLVNKLIIEQLESGVVRFTDFGYKEIQKDLKRIKSKKTSK